MKILVLNGPNLNLLGTREPDIYGTDTLDDILDRVEQQASKINVALTRFQSNAEHLLIDRIHQSLNKIDAIIINAGALTHTSVALRDALAGVNIPFIEVHISNVHKREAFRAHSYLSDIASGVIVGVGTQCYSLALTALHHLFSHSPIKHTYE